MTPDANTIQINTSMDWTPENLSAQFQEYVEQFGLNIVGLALNTTPLIALSDNPQMLDTAVRTALSGDRGVFVMTIPGDGGQPRFNSYLGNDIDVRVAMHLGTDCIHTEGSGERITTRN